MGIPCAGERAAWVWIPGCEAGWMVSGLLGMKERGWRTGLLGLNLEAEIWTDGSEEEAEVWTSRSWG